MIEKANFHQNGGNPRAGRHMKGRNKRHRVSVVNGFRMTDISKDIPERECYRNGCTEMIASLNPKAVCPRCRQLMDDLNHEMSARNGIRDLMFAYSGDFA